MLSSVAIVGSPLSLFSRSPPGKPSVLVPANYGLAVQLCVKIAPGISYWLVFLSAGTLEFQDGHIFQQKKVQSQLLSKRIAAVFVQWERESTLRLKLCQICYSFDKQALLNSDTNKISLFRQSLFYSCFAVLADISVVQLKLCLCCHWARQPAWAISLFMQPLGLRSEWQNSVQCTLFSAATCL